MVKLISSFGIPTFDVYDREPEPPIYSEWVEQRRNLFLDPSATSVNSFISNSGVSFPVTKNEFGVHWDFLLKGAVNIGMLVDILTGSEYRIMLRSRGIKVLAPRLRLRNSTGPYVSVNTSWEWFEWTGVAGTGQIAQTGFLLNENDVVVNDWIEIDRVLVASAPDTGEWFDGDTYNEELKRTRWLGEPNNSISILETRTRLN